MTVKVFSTVARILSYQFAVILCTAIIFWILKGKNESISAWLGGMIAFIPNLYFAIRVQRSEGLEPKKVLNNFYIGEVGKFILTVILFILTFRLPNIQLIPLLITYITALSVLWFALLMR